MKEQQIEKAMDGIENRIRHIYNCGYQQGYEDGKNSYGTEIRTKQDVDEAYQHGYSDGLTKGTENGYKRGYGNGKKNHEKVRNDDMGYGYRRGLEDAWECARKLRHPRYGGYYDNEKLDIFGYENSDDVLTNFTADQAMQKIKDYEERQTETITYPQVDGVTPTVVKADQEPTSPCDLCKFNCRDICCLNCPAMPKGGE